MTNLKRLYEEYKALKDELFEGSSFVLVDDNDPRNKRYDQLFQLFHPGFRTASWTCPLEQESEIMVEYELYYSMS